MHAPLHAHTARASLPEKPEKREKRRPRAPVTDRRGGGAERAPRSLQSQEIRTPAFRAPKPTEILLGGHVKGSLKVKTQVWEHQEPSRTTVQGQAILSEFPSSPSCPGRPLGFRWLRLIPSCFRAGSRNCIRTPLRNLTPPSASRHLELWVPPKAQKRNGLCWTEILWCQIFIKGFLDPGGVRTSSS
ncbi:uncharacterized protein LOC125162623 isoform X3 [Prionailurus viverrinus]|uniref:uncharacterized protein LOC125162623 isoform X3 n=1 Tax=Prionailurus viverrinus TaxID=61388 RepID=UPI001FF3A7C5|nr:uncharacterized protein LOC125162623 isoform X3 [Prionailurus viverrinus]